MIFLQLFYSFFLIGLFGFGGGYGMLSLIQTQTVVEYHWLTSSQFTDIVAISQMTPGPIGLNAATYCGYTALHNTGAGTFASIMGSIVSTIAVSLPSIILMIIITRFLLKYMKTTAIQSVFVGLRPAVVGLLAAAALLLCNKENFASLSTNPWQFWVSIFIFSFTFIGTMWLKINPIRMICYAALAGLVLLY